MQSIGEILLQAPPLNTNIRSKRQYIISQFVEEINAEAEKPFKPSYIAFRLSHLNINDLEYFFQSCNRYRLEGKGPFGKCFWGSLKIKS